MWQGQVRRYNIVVKLRVKETAIVAAICVEYLNVSPLLYISRKAVLHKPFLLIIYFNIKTEVFHIKFDVRNG